MLYLKVQFKYQNRMQLVLNVDSVFVNVKLEKPRLKATAKLRLLALMGEK